MGFDVMGEIIGWVQRDRRIDRPLGAHGIAGFLMRKGPHCPEAVVAG